MNPTQTSLFDPLWVDCFAGGGGWSTGVELAIVEIERGVRHELDRVHT